jgi:hypothetical protein
MVSPYLISNLYVDKSNTVYTYLQAIGAKIYFSFNFVNVTMRHTDHKLTKVNIIHFVSCVVLNHS